jgi:type IV pilus assembly protein PilQ
MKKLISIAIFSCVIISQVIAQQYLEKSLKTYRNPDELVTMSANLPFNKAVELLNKVSESTTGKKIVSIYQSDSPIGVELTNIPYDKALVIIVQYAGLIYEEKEDVIIIKKSNEIQEERTIDTYASVDSREVKISAVFFEMDVNESRKRGIDWQFLLSKKGLDVGGSLIGESTQGQTQNEGETTAQEQGFNINTSTDFDIGGFFGEATAMFKFFETENLGEIIASPNIIVRDRKLGRIQVGSDFSVRTRDFAGNTVEKFFPTGTIIEVTPYVYSEDGVDYMLLNIIVERSSFVQGEGTTEIKKTTASTQIVMLDGEETILGGLFVNEEVKVRNGIPFLKDLPWWVLGIRYLTGSDGIELRKKELVILIKAELVPTLKDRLAGPREENVLQNEVLRNRDKIRYYQLNEEIKNQNEETN